MFFCQGLERREVEKRIFERKRLTASATFLIYKIPDSFEHPITDLKTKCDGIMNVFYFVPGKISVTLNRSPSTSSRSCPF